MKTFIGIHLPFSFGKCCCFSFFIILSSWPSSYAFDHAAPDNKAISVKTSTATLAANRLARARAIARKAELKMISLEALDMFREMQLEDSGLNEKALEYALIGYHHLLKKGVLHRTDVLSICDFSQSSSLKRMYVIDVQNRKVLYRTYVAHGINSGSEYANSFSNVAESHKSSLGFYVTRGTYYGGNGLSLRIDGLDRGFNSRANQRNIVIHGAPYVSERILHKYGVMGTTFGCPAIPAELTNEIIPAIKDGTCFFIYYPSKRYLGKSSVLNG
ncbi:MAG TPA: murein L,D-transpeptidase catalytic domain family protein [Puia sp.]|nr:murein L,D-transpeptidase catalytic domain family protein [Puia sp.]